MTDYTSVNTENSSVHVYVRARPPDPSWTLEDDDTSVEDKFQNPLQATLAGAFARAGTVSWRDNKNESPTNYSQGRWQGRALQLVARWHAENCGVLSVFFFVS